VMLRGAEDASEMQLIERSEAIGCVLPTVQFMLQTSIGGRIFSPLYWRTLFDLPSTIAVNVAPFDRYMKHYVVTLLLESDRWTDMQLTERSEAIGCVLPTVQFMLQTSIWSRIFSPLYWRKLFVLPSTIAVKVAPFDRYMTQHLVTLLLESDRWNDIALLTGNDD